MIGRRFFLTGLGLVGLGAAGYGGSLTACRMGRTETAMLKPLLVALRDIRAPDRIGQVWLQRERPDDIARELLSRADLMEAALMPELSSRRETLTRAIRGEFSRGDIVVVDRWVVSRTEARLAALWMSA